jgi:hypothetical protein
MRRTSIAAALLTAPLLLAFAGIASANPPKQCYYGKRCGGFCLLNFSRMHQIGPLFNYGPYYGYPPFEPYGPWNSYLQYTGGYGGGGGHGHGHGGHDRSGHGALCGSHGGVFGHASWLKGGWFHGRCGLGCGHGSHGDCGSGGCKADAFNPATTDAVTRYAGTGNAANSAVYYTGLPALMPAGGVAK